MSYISYGFIIFTAISLILYAVLPSRTGRTVLLVMSLLFVFLNGGLVSLGVLLAETAAAYIAGLWIGMACKRGAQSSDISGQCIDSGQSNQSSRSHHNAGGCLLAAAVIAHVFILFYFKYRNFPTYTMELISQIMGGEYCAELVDSVAAVGISYYTLMLISYEADVYLGKYKAERNPLRLLLFASFFPHIIQGPIDSYDDAGKTLFKNGGIRYIDFIQGSLRICYGLIKKLIISERIAIFVNAVFADYGSYPAFILILAAFGFTLRLYTDFSGCMDIVIGISRMFGIRICENFRNPFFSQSIAEFWRRWHITLGAFFRKYVYIPLGGNRGGKLRKFRNNLIVFFLSGLWHGGNWSFVIGVGLLQSLYMIAGECLMPLRAGLLRVCGIRGDSGVIRVMRSLWVFVLISIGFVFFNSVNAASGAGYLKAIATGQESMYECLTLSSFGLNAADMVIIITGLMGIFAVEFFQEHSNNAVKVCAKSVDACYDKPIPESASGSVVRDNKTAATEAANIWHNKIGMAENLILLSIVLVILLGCYGRGYDASAFIYSRF